MHVLVYRGQALHMLALCLSPTWKHPTATPTFKAFYKRLKRSERNVPKLVCKTTTVGTSRHACPVHLHAHFVSSDTPSCQQHRVQMVRGVHA